MKQLKSMTVKELKDKLNTYPEDMYVFAQWEGQNKIFMSENFEIIEGILVIDVEYC